MLNETVSVGDTTVSLHVLGGGGGLVGWFILDYSKLKVPRPDQIFMGGGGILDYSRIGYFWQNVQKFCHAMPYSGSPCVADGRQSRYLTSFREI